MHVVGLVMVGSALAGKGKDAEATCPGLPADQRPSVVVDAVTVQAVAPETMAPALTAKVRTNLLTTGCFTVDLEGEAGRYALAAIVSDYSDRGKSTAVVVNGETTQMWRAELALVLTLTDRETDQVLTTHVLKTEGKQRVIPSRRNTGPYGSEVSPAMEEAIDASLTEITAWLVPWRERLDVPR